MNMTLLINILNVFLVLAMAELLSTTPFALYANAWACVPTSTSSRNNASTTKTPTTLNAREFKLPRKYALSPSLMPWQCHKHGSSSSSSSLSSSTPFLDEPSTTVTPSTTSSTSSIKIDESNSVLKPNNSNAANDLFFIRPALFVDMDRGSKILADGFFKGPKTNWFTYQYEKFVTYLSLEANFPRTQQQRSRYEICVACCVKTGQVWGLVEIDARGTTKERTSKVYEKSGGSPYMCNLAVDEKHQRKGIATSLVYECERQVNEWYSEDECKRKKEDEETNKNEMINDIVSSDSIFGTKPKTKYTMSNSVCLKVRESNKAAVQMYLKLGYVTVFEEIEDGKTDENILLMRKKLNFLSPPSPKAELASR